MRTGDYGLRRDGLIDMSAHIHGTGVSRRIAVGTATIVPRGHINITYRNLQSEKIPAEQQRYHQAIESAKQRLIDISSDLPGESPADIRTLINTQLLMLEDPTLYKTPLEIIAKESCNAEWALKQQHNALLQVFENIDDTYLKARRHDITHIVNRIQRLLLQEASLSDMVTKIKDLSRQVLVIDDIGPAELIAIHQRGIAGFITEFGGPLSHTAILARSLDIPAIFGVHRAQHLFESGEPIIIDGEHNAVISSPDRHIQRWYRQKIQDYRNRQKALDKLCDQKAVSLNGETIELQANIELPDDIRLAKKSGCTGVGLLRTEYMFINRENLPDEEEQYKAYRSVIRRMKGMPVTIRTLDLGADKQVDSGRSDAPLQVNPALGLRAVRLCLQDHKLFHTQLKAILRAAYGYNVRIMIPMITTLQEIKQVKYHMSSVKASLGYQGVKYAKDVPIGVMIEVPAAAIMASSFARHCDFLSIGTNDLIQYTLAIDRVDDSVSYLYDPLHPAILRLIKITLDTANDVSIPVSMCGEMAGDSQYTCLLLGMGLREFSMQPSSLLQVKEIISQTDITRVTRLADEILGLSDSAAIHDLLESINSTTLH